MEAATFTVREGTAPLFVSFPHIGTGIPDDIASDFVPRALALEDTDWHLDRVYDFLADLGVGTIMPVCSRYVIDLNRPPANERLYAGVNTTALCPTRFFSGDPLYRDGREPGEGEVARRLDRYWRPYHKALEAQLARIRAQHGYAMLFDAHSIRSQLPWLFEGRLPDLNLGTVGGASCAPSLREALGQSLKDFPAFTSVVDGRFRGGHITRHYGRPQDRVHAVQLEMCWSCYMEECAPYEPDAARLQRLRPVLESLISTLLAWGRQHGSD